MSKHGEFLKERKHLKNRSQRTIEWHEQSLAWLGVKEPTETDLKRVVLRAVCGGEEEVLRKMDHDEIGCDSL